MLRLCLFFLCLSLSFTDEISDLETVVKKDSSDLKSMYQLAVKLFQAKEYEKSLVYWKSLNKARPDDAKMKYSMAKTMFMMKDIDEALMICQKIQTVEGGEKCAELFKEAEESHADAFNFYKARLEFSNKNHDKAMEILKPLLEQEVENPKYRYLLGSYYRTQKKYAFALDQYNFAEEKMGKSERITRLKEGLFEVGKEAYAYINKNKGNITNEKEFYENFFNALKLYEEETNQRAKGFKQKAIDFFQAQMMAGTDVFENKYRIAWITLSDFDTQKAKDMFKEAQKEAPDDSMYASLEYLIQAADKKKSSTGKIDDLINMAGGEDVYNALLKASKQADADKLKAQAQAAVPGSGEAVQQAMNNPNVQNAMAGIDKAKFVAAFDDYKRRMQRANTEEEKKAVKDAMMKDYPDLANMMKDPNSKAQMESFLKSSDGQKMKEQYGGQAEALKGQLQNLK